MADFKKGDTASWDTEQVRRSEAERRPAQRKRRRKRKNPILGIILYIPTVLIVSALLAGIGVGLYESKEQAASMVTPDLTFQPEMAKIDRDRALHGWKRAVERSRDWVEDK
jgi:hypothetical protein